MSGDFPSQYLQANGNGSFTGANTQQMSTGYEIQQHHPTYPWMGSDQQLVSNQTIISGATIATPPTTLNASNVATTSSKSLYHTQSSETNNNFIQAQNTPIVGSNVRKPNIKQADNNVNANVNTPINTNGGVTIGNNQNRTPEYSNYIDYTQKCVQLILEINYELIRVCIDYQNKGITNDQDLAMYKSRLQANLSYLATVADEYNGNSRNPDLQEFKQKMIPDLSPLPIPRSSFGQKINTLLQRASQVFAHQKKFQRIGTNPALAVLASNNASNNNNNSSTITTSHMLDPSSTSPPRQFKMGQPPNSSIIGAQMLQQQTSQQLHQPQQNSQQSANRFTNSMMPTATISTTYQQHHPTPQHQNMSTTSNISDYAMMNASTNSEQSYQVSLPPLVGIGNMSMGNTGAGNGGAGNIQGSGILPSIIGIGDQYGMSQQQQLQQLQNVGYAGYIGGGGTGAGISGTGFGTTNAYGMMRYPSAGGNGMGNNPLAGNPLTGNSLSGNSLAGSSLTSTVMGGGGNGLAGSGLANNMGGIMSGNNYGNNTIVGNSLGLPSMMNHDNGMG
ncbi:5146_t:CDS:2 [Rhizophagus irregularis]|nr:5146_t:CDS:2 [Rhizophagus irregularis]